MEGSNERMTNKNMAASVETANIFFHVAAHGRTPKSLALLDSIVGADGCAAAAADASIRVDVIDFTLGNSLNGAYRLTCAACDATVCNNVSHNCSV